jgi:hypothetical protein
LFDSAISRLPADARLQVLLREVRLAAREGLGQQLVVGGHRPLDGQLEQLHAQVPGHRPGVGLRAGRGVARRHDRHADALGPQRVHRHEQDQGGVHAAGQAQADVREAVLLDVVARAEDERGVDLGDGIERLGDLAPPALDRGARGRARRQRRQSRDVRARLADRGARAGVAQARAAGASVSTSHTSSASANCGARATGVPVWSSTTLSPSKTSSSWPPTSAQKATATRPSRARWASIRSRCIALPACYGEAEMFTISRAPASASSLSGVPGIQTSSQIVQADRHAVDLDDHGLRPGLEVPQLVEDAVVGQAHLAVDALHPPVGADRGGVVDVVVALGEPDDRDDAGAARREAVRARRARRAGSAP